MSPRVSSSLPSSLLASLPVRHRVVGGAVLALLLVTWISTGSLVLAALVVVLVAGTVGLAALLLTWAAREPAEDLAARVPDAVLTTDLHHVPTPGARVRGALRGLLARPWVRGDGLVRAASARLASADALVWTPRGQQVAAPHVWVEWNSEDLAEIAGRWPLPVLARELADGYADHVRETGVRRMADRSVLHLLAGADVPRGRVVVTAAFSRPQRDAIVTAHSPEGSRAVSPRSTPSGPSAPPSPRRPGSTQLMPRRDPRPDRPAVS